MLFFCSAISVPENVRTVVVCFSRGGWGTVTWQRSPRGWRGTVFPRMGQDRGGGITFFHNLEINQSVQKWSYQPAVKLTGTSHHRNGAIWCLAISMPHMFVVISFAFVWTYPCRQRSNSEGYPCVEKTIRSSELLTLYMTCDLASDSSVYVYLTLQW